MASATARTSERLPSISHDSLVTTAGGGGGAEVVAAAVDATSSAGGKTVGVHGGEGGRGGGCISAASTVGPDRRVLLGVGTYLIDTPRDPALLLRQKFLSFQEQHRGVVKSQNETLPDIIPYRLNPKPEETTKSSISDDNRTVYTTMVDMATSPIFPYVEDWNLSTLDMISPDPSCVFGNIFLTDRDMMNLTVRDPNDGVTSLDVKETDEDEMTSRQVKDVTDGEMTSRTVRSIKTVPVKRVKEKPKPTIVEPIARSVSFSERPQRKSFPKRIRDLATLSQLPATSTANVATSMSVAKLREAETPNPLIDRLLFQPDSARTPRKIESPWKRTSSSVSDLTEIGSTFSWHDKEFERRTVQSLDMNSDKYGPTSFFQMKKSRSLLDILRSSRKYDLEGKDQDLDVAYQRRLAPLNFRRGNTFKRSSFLESDETDKEWRDIVNTRVIDDTDYDKFASRRKPVTPSKPKKNSKTTSAKGGRDPKATQGDNGKLCPLFVSLSTQAKKFGRALQHNRKFLRSK